MSVSLPSASFCCDSPRSYQGDLISAFGEEMTGLKGVRWFVKQVTGLVSRQLQGPACHPTPWLFFEYFSPISAFLTFLNSSHICINVPFLSGQSGPPSPFSFAPSLPYFCLQYTRLADTPPIPLCRMDACFSCYFVEPETELKASLLHP